MNRLRRYYEKVPYGQTSRVAYATSAVVMLCQVLGGAKIQPSTQVTQFSPTQL